MGATVSEQNSASDGSTSASGNFWGFVTFWGLHVWILGYCVVFLSAFYIQFAKGEFPCPLCMLQRYGMFLSCLAALFVVMQARRGTLTTARYAQGLGMGALGALAGAAVSTRQILLHILPDDPGYGEPVFGMSLYTWAFVTFTIVLLYCAVMLILMPKGNPVAPQSGSALRSVSTAVIWLFIALLAANVIAIVFLEGFALVLPDEPTGYNLID